MYLDTSVVVKLYMNEPDSQECESALAGHSLVSSSLLLCEFRSALLAKISRGLVSADLGSEIWREFQNDLAGFKLTLIPLSDPLVRDAAEILEELYPSVSLRTLDALHLATYLGVEAGTFFTKDRRQREAARHLGVDMAA